MSYTPQTWANGDIITATKLNNIESGVQSVSNSYTPTTWVNGDIITAVKLNNIEQGIANAGGGSSDFSTAEVTIVNTVGRPITFKSALFDDEGSFTGSTTVFSEETIVTVLYDGVSATDTSIDGMFSSVVVTGDASYDGDVSLTITGDCTITIS